MADIIQRLGYLAGGSRFRRIYEHLQIGGDKVYKEAGFDFKSSWFPVFYVLSKSPQPQTVMEITDQIDFSHITVKNIVRELEKKRLIKIIPNPGDRRSILISLTEKGKKLSQQFQPLWRSFSIALKDLLTAGHPDISNILKRIDAELSKDPLNERVLRQPREKVVILDYRPSLKKHFYELAGPWLSDVLKGKLEEEDKAALLHPDVTYLQQGGFLFYAQYQGEIVGCVGIKRLDEDSFELVKLFIDPKYRQLGIATRLIDRCISRCKENEARQLWLQTTLSMPEAHRLYDKLGFEDRKAPRQMTVLKRTEKIMCLIV